MKTCIASHLADAVRRSCGLRVIALGTFLVMATLASPVNAGLIYNWSFGASDPMGPVTGTISFDSVTPGAGGTMLTPDSITITSAPGHVFTSGYSLGDEVIGSPLGNLINLPSNPAWTIDTNDQIIGGGAAFIAAPSGSADQLVLDVIDSVNDGNSFLNTSTGITSTSDLTFTAAVPEPSSLGLLGLLGVGLVCRRRRERNRRNSVDVTA